MCGVCGWTLTRTLPPVPDEPLDPGVVGRAAETERGQAGDAPTDEPAPTQVDALTSPAPRHHSARHHSEPPASSPEPEPEPEPAHDPVRTRAAAPVTRPLGEEFDPLTAPLAVVEAYGLGAAEIGAGADVLVDAAPPGYQVAQAQPHAMDYAAAADAEDHAEPDADEISAAVPETTRGLTQSARSTALAASVGFVLATAVSAALDVQLVAIVTALLAVASTLGAVLTLGRGRPDASDLRFALPVVGLVAATALVVIDVVALGGSLLVIGPSALVTAASALWVLRFDHDAAS